MRTIRVLIRDGPTMLRDILERTITNAPDMEAVLDPPGAPQDAVERQPPAPGPPDVVLVGVRESGPIEDASTLLERWPRSRVFMIAEHGRRAVMYRMVPQETDMGEMSPDQLLEAVRSSVRGGA
jgi:hypothetical protein